MDELKISNCFMRKLIGKLVKVAIKKKIGCDVDLSLNELNVTVTEDQAHLHLNVDADMSNRDLIELLKGIGIEEEL